jgi:WD40 repeat protein
MSNLGYEAMVCGNYRSPFTMHLIDPTGRPLPNPLYFKTVAQNADRVAFSPNSRWVAICDWSVAILLDTTTWTHVSLPNTGSGIRAVSFSRDSAYVALATGAGVKVYSTTAATLDRTILSGVINACAFSPIADHLLICRSTSTFVFLYDTSDVLANWADATPGGLTSGSAIADGCAAFSDDGTKLAVLNATSPRVHVYATSDWSPVSHSLTFTSAQQAVCFSRDGRYLAVANSTAPRIHIYDFQESEAVVPDTTGIVGSEQLAFTPDGSKLLVAQRFDNNDPLLVIDMATLTTSHFEFPVEVERPYGIARSPNDFLYGVRGTVTPDGVVTILERDTLRLANRQEVSGAYKVFVKDADLKVVVCTVDYESIDPVTLEKNETATATDLVTPSREGAV